MLTVDLNCDLGESTDPAQHATDLALLEIVTSANIACGGGGHAGDDSTMAATVEAALARGVAIGAHPGYPDRANFGRVALDMTPTEIEASVFEQITSLDRIVHDLGGPRGARLAHIKTHGALYHRAMSDEVTASAVAAATRRINPSLLMVAMPSTLAMRVWQELGFTVATEVFADRAYDPDGSLRSRTLPDALITDPQAAATQALALVNTHGPASSPLTLCIHSDTPHAVTIAAAVRAALEHTGVRIARPALR
jgi:UPF0271 protein